MLRNSFTFNFNKLPIAFLLTVFAVIGIEMVLSSFEDYLYPYPFEGLRMKVKNDLSQLHGDSYDVLVLGDCYNIVGVIPDIIEEKTHLKCFNFSHHKAQSIAASYLLFENYLKTHDRKPRYIIITYLPEVIDDEEPDLTYLYDFSHGNRMEFMREFGFIHMCKSLFPSIRKQGYLKNVITDPSSVFSSVHVSKNEFINQVIYQDKGYYHRYTDRFYEGGDQRHFDKFHFSPFFKKYFEKINNLAMENGIKVIYVMPAFPPDIMTAFKKEAYQDYYMYFQYWQKQENSDFIILNPHNTLNGNSLFNDATHLNRKGAEELSNYLADAINSINPDQVANLHD